MDDTQKAAGLTIGGLFALGLLAFFLTQSEGKTANMLVPFDLKCGNATGLVYCHMNNLHYASPAHTDMYFLVIPPTTATEKVSLASASMDKKSGSFTMKGTEWHEIVGLENVTITTEEKYPEETITYDYVDLTGNGTKQKIANSKTTLATRKVSTNTLNITWLVEPAKEIDLKKRYVAIANTSLFAQGDVAITLGAYSDD